MPEFPIATRSCIIHEHYFIDEFCYTVHDRFIGELAPVPGPMAFPEEKKVEAPRFKYTRHHQDISTRQITRVKP